MGLMFTNPAALWALLGLPVVLLLHFLQSKNRRARISTLFLLEHLQEDTRKGAVFTRLRTGAQLWLQLLSVLLITFLLSQPRRVREDSVQQVAVVVDTSSSMQAFQEALPDAVTDLARRIDTLARESQWWVMPSDSVRPRIFMGTDTSEMRSSLTRTEFTSGLHDPSIRLREARRIVGADGLVIYLSDHVPAELPADVVLRTLGTPLDNVSLSGILIEADPSGQRRWKVSVVNRSPEATVRTISLRDEQGVFTTSEISLPASGLRTVEGILPPGVNRGEARLEPADAFPLDDVIPFVRPLPKTLTVSLDSIDDSLQTWVARIVDTVPGAVRRSGGDLWVGMSEQGYTSGASVAGSIQFIQGDDTATYQRILPLAHPLVEDLEWDSLVAQPFRGVQVRPSDRVLLRMGEFPLIILRREAGGPSLVFHFDPRQGNGIRHAGLALLLHRFLRSVQSGLDEEEWDNTITGQPYRLPEGKRQFTPVGENRVEEWSSQTHLPSRPGWLSVTRDGETRLHLGIAHGNMEEGDFRSAVQTEIPDELFLTQRRQHEEADFLFPLWMSLLGITLLGTWWTGEPRSLTATRR